MPERGFFGYASILAATVTWATSGIFIKLIILRSGMSEISLAFWRDSMTCALLFITLLIFRPGMLRIRREDLKYFVGLGCLGLGTFHIMWNYSAMINGVAVSTVQQAMMPVILAVAARFVFAEPFTFRKSAALVLTLGGTVLISGLLTSRSGPGGLAGLLVGIAVPVTYAMYNLFSKLVTGRYHPLTIITYGFGFASLILLPARLASGKPVPFAWGTAGLIAGLVVVATLFPFAVYTFTLRRFQVSLAGIMSMSEIPFAFLYAFLVFGEALTPLQYAGTAVIIAGVLLCIRLRPLGHKAPRG